MTVNVTAVVFCCVFARISTGTLHKPKQDTKGDIKKKAKQATKTQDQITENKTTDDSWVSLRELNHDKNVF